MELQKNVNFSWSIFFLIAYFCIFFSHHLCHSYIMKQSKSGGLWYSYLISEWECSGRLVVEMQGSMGRGTVVVDCLFVRVFRWRPWRPFSPVVNCRSKFIWKPGIERKNKIKMIYEKFTSFTGHSSTSVTFLGRCKLMKHDWDEKNVVFFYILLWAMIASLMFFSRSYLQDAV